MKNETKTTEEIKEEKKVPPLNTIYFYLTKGCNLCCRHCWVAPKHQTEETKYPELSIEQFMSVIDQAKPLGITGVKLIVGEHFMHSQIKEIL